MITLRGTEHRPALGARADPIDAFPRSPSPSLSLSLWFRFCALKGNEFFSEVEEEFAQDAFNLTGLEQLVPYFDQALDMILDVELTDIMTEETQEVIENDAENLFGLIHARYIITSRGLQAMVSPEGENTQRSAAPTPIDDATIHWSLLPEHPLWTAPHCRTARCPDDEPFPCAAQSAHRLTDRPPLLCLLLPAPLCASAPCGAPPCCAAAVFSWISIGCSTSADVRECCAAGRRCCLSACRIRPTRTQ